MAKALNKSLSKNARTLILKQKLTEEEVEVLDKEIADTGSNGEKATKHLDPVGSNGEKTNVKEADETDEKDEDGKDKDKVEEDADSMAKVRAAKKDGGKDDDKDEDDKEDVKEEAEDDKDEDKKDKEDVKEDAKPDSKFDWDDEDMKEATDDADVDTKDKDKVEEDHEELTNKPAKELGSTGVDPKDNHDSDVKILSKVSEEDDGKDEDGEDKEKVEEDADSMAKVRAAKKDGDKKDDEDEDKVEEASDETEDEKFAKLKKDDKKDGVKESTLIKYRRANKTLAEKTAHKKQIQEAVKALFKGTDVSAEFLERAETVFEASLNKRVLEEAKAIDAIARRAVQRRVAKEKAYLEEMIDSYAGRVVKEWSKDNEVAIETGIRVELAESLLSQMKVLFERHNIEVPSNKVNLVEEQQKQIAALTEKVNKVTDKLISTENDLFEARKLEALAEISDGLAATQVVKLQKLTEDLDAKDLDTFKKKATTIKESFFAKNKDTTENKEETKEATVNPMMQKFIDFSAKHAKD